MNVFLWVVQIVLGAMFLIAGGVKVRHSHEKLAESMRWVDDFSSPQVKAIGALEFLGGLGLILPGWLDSAPILTPLAALGIAIVMAGAWLTHRRRNEPRHMQQNILLFVLAAIVVVGRFFIEPL